MKRYHNIIYLLAMILVVGLFVVVFNFFPRPVYSELENRELKRMPRLTLDSLMRGEYMSAISSWYSDSQPYRDNFLMLSMEFDNAKRLSFGLSAEEEVTFIAGDEEVDEQIDEEPIIQERADSLTLVEPVVDSTQLKPKAEDKAKFANHGIILLGSAPTVRALTGYRAGPESCNPYAEMANKYQEVLGSGVQVYCMLIPTGVEFYCPEKARSRVKSQRETIDNAYSKLDSCVLSVDAYREIAKHTDEDIYLRTDHHWAPLGAYYAAKAFAEVAGVPFKDLSHYERRVVKRYVGSMFRYSGDVSVKRSPEDFVFYVPQDIDYTTTYINYIVDENYMITGSLPAINDNYFYHFKDGSGGAYCTFMGGDNKITQVRTATDNGRRMLLLKDSFGNALPGYLFYSFEEIHIIDARYFTRNIVEYVKENGITDFVFGNNVAFAASKSTINFYSTFLKQKSRF